MDINIKDIFMQCINDLTFEACEDQLVGVGKIVNEKFEFSEKWILKDERIKNKENLKTTLYNDKKTIVIILESPHRNEFLEDFIGPALGKTGEKLDEYLEKRLNEKLSELSKKTAGKLNGEYRVILCNAIQYQASLGLDTEYLRDRVWLNLWLKRKLRNNFIERLKSYNPDIIFNLCTLGSHLKDPFYKSDNKENLKKIRYDYLKCLNLNIKQGQNKKELFKNNELIYKANYVKKGKTENTYVYSLKGFVATAIDDSFNNKLKPIILEDYHPSSGHFK